LFLPEVLAARLLLFGVLRPTQIINSNGPESVTPQLSGIQDRRKETPPHKALSQMQDIAMKQKAGLLSVCKCRQVVLH
jgi:hypothetical protein